MKPERVTAKDCLTCGVCCVSLKDQPAFCDVLPEDEARLGKAFVRRHVHRFHLLDHALSRILKCQVGSPELPPGAIKTKWVKQRSGPLKGSEVLVCVALRGSVLHQVRCSVYERRPYVCREAVKPGDRTCLWLRREIRRVADESSCRDG